jgi:NTP pyrophosphatase (non-canonical NTP hydrolase)
MRALKGIRQKDNKKLGLNLLISISWLMSITNRLHINVEEAVWQRFPGVCSYCGLQPCACEQLKPTTRVEIKKRKLLKPKTLKNLQEMFALIYPPTNRTLFEAGVHLAEETGEVSEAIHCFWGEHKKEQFERIENEIADWISCLFGVANSANIDVAGELAKMYYNNCHVCHQAPCVCNFSFVAKFKS